MGLPNDLRAAVEHAPPPEFDLDQLIRQGRARKVRSSVFATVGAFAVVGLVLAAGYATAAGFRSAGSSQVVPQQPGAPAPAPAPTASPTPTLPATPGPWTDMRSRGVVVGTPAEQANAARLTAALAQLPAELAVPTDGSVQFTVRHQPPIGTMYNVFWSAEGMQFSINIWTEEPGADDDCSPGEDANGCAGDRDANGIVYVTGAEEYFGALYVRDDGTFVDFLVQVEPGTERVPSDVRSSVRDAARSPGLTLFP